MWLRVSCGSDVGQMWVRVRTGSGSGVAEVLSCPARSCTISFTQTSLVLQSLCDRKGAL